MSCRSRGRPDPKARLAWAAVALLSASVGAGAQDITPVPIISPDQAFTTGVIKRGQTFRMNRVRCFVDKPPSYEPTCEAKTRGGNSVVIKGAFLSYETDLDVKIESYAKRMCLGDSRLNSRECEFSITTEARFIGPVTLIDSAQGQIGARLITTGKISARR